MSLKQLFSYGPLKRLTAHTVQQKITIYAKSAKMELLLDILEKQNETGIKWFKQNKIIVNPDKF